MNQGIIIVNKPAGITSMDVVAKMRRILHIRKIGHTGTLDPDATGVLPVCIGRAVKAVEILMNGNEKEYETVMLLGRTTDTEDSGGNVISESDEYKRLTEKEIEEAAERFKGDIFQIPPMYSAVKIGGKKLVDLARKGIDVEREKRPVTIYDIEIKKIDLPRVSMRVRCSKGTYIRTLCSDMGRALGCGACMETLQRTETDGMTLDMAHTLEEIEELNSADMLDSILIPTDRLFEDAPALYMTPENDRFVIHGNALTPEQLKETDNPGLTAAFTRVYLSDGSFAALYKWDEKRKIYTNFKMFLESIE